MMIEDCYVCMYSGFVCVHTAYAYYGLTLKKIKALRIFRILDLLRI